MDDSIRELQTLHPGNSFEIIGLEHYFRKLTVAHINDSCVTVNGEVSTSDNLDGKSTSWRPLINHTMSCRTEVRIIL